MPIPTALTIAGSDSGGGAGIQADLKVFAEHRVYGMSVITAITAQNTVAVTAIHLVPADVVRAQIAAVLADLPVGAIKIGMLGSEEIAAVVAESLVGFKGPVVLDPVLVAKSGDRLLAERAEAALRELVVPRATVVTPNLPEAAVLLGDEPPSDWAVRTGKALLLKDGHGTGSEVADRLYLPDGRVRTWRHPRQETRNTHGTGCTLSSAVAARLARGEALEHAVERSLVYVTTLLRLSSEHELGAGHGPLLHASVGVPFE